MTRRQRIAGAALYLCAPANLRAGRLAEWIGRLGAAGVDVVQLRDRSLAPAELAAEAGACAAAARAAGVLFIINDDPQLAAACGADGVHLGQGDGAIADARDVLGPDRIVGRTSRGGTELAAAAADGADYASVSPVWATPTKPGRAAVGLAAVAAAARTATVPWFALGSIDERRARRLAALGATRIACVRAIVDAEDPAAAARALRAALASPPRVLSIAGSDSGGGAGIQADIKAIVRAGAFPMTAITAITAQNTVGVRAASLTPPDLIAEQVRSVVEDIGVDAVKTGMLGSARVVRATAALLAELDPHDEIPIVVDPVLRAESGAALMESSGLRAYIDHLLPRATVTTPNVFEAAALVDRPDSTSRDLARELAARCGCAVIVTGGHGPDPADVLAFGDGRQVRIAGVRLSVGTTHGAGCTHSATLAAHLAQGAPLVLAARAAKRAATRAVRDGIELGAGAGPVDVTGGVRPRRARPPRATPR